MDDQAIQAVARLATHVRRISELLFQMQDVVRRLSPQEAPHLETIGTLVGCLNEAVDLVGAPPDRFDAYAKAVEALDEG